MKKEKTIYDVEAQDFEYVQLELQKAGIEILHLELVIETNDIQKNLYFLELEVSEDVCNQFNDSIKEGLKKWVPAESTRCYFPYEARGSMALR